MSIATVSSIILQASQSPVSNPEASQGPKSSKNGLSGGTVAGIAIGMFVVGILIAGVVFFILLRRQKSKQASAIAYDSQHLPLNGQSNVVEKSPVVVNRAVSNKLDDLLPQPVADDTITDEASKIRDNIKNHVRTYHHSAPIPSAGLNEAGLRDIATAAGVSTSVLAGALSNPSSRPDALRLVIGWVILSRCTSERHASLLPAELASIVNSIPGRDGASTTQSALYSKWKTITGALLLQRFGKNTQDPNRVQTFASTIAELDSIVAPFLHRDVDGGQRRKNLDMILTRSANFAFVLFSQPGSFSFDFSNAHGGLVAFPAMLQTIGDQGQMLNPPRVLVEKEIAV